MQSPTIVAVTLFFLVCGRVTKMTERKTHRSEEDAQLGIINAGLCHLSGRVIVSKLHRYCRGARDLLSYRDLLVARDSTVEARLFKVITLEKPPC